MKQRKKDYGNVNIIGKNVERLRKSNGFKMGLDINPTSYSKLEGQIRLATDKEVYLIAKALNVPIEDLFE